MRREKRNDKKEEKIKWGKLISFLVAIILLGVAIAISMNQERTIGEINYNNFKNSDNTSTLSTEQASSELSKNVNEVKKENNITENNTINSVEKNEVIENENNNETSKTNEIKNNEVVKTNTESNETNNKEENEIDENKNEVNNETVPETKFIFPVEGEVIKEFAKDSLIYSETLEEWLTHNGIDIKAERSTVVKAVASGTVKSIKNDPRYGLTVTIEHSDGYTSSYSSLLTAEFVKEGEEVTQGQTIGTVGNSAVFEVAEDNHLHFELLKDGSNINPEMYLK